MPPLYAHTASVTAADTRVLDSRQLRNAMRAISATAREITAHISLPRFLKRQSTVLAIPTQYQGLRAGPAPGTVVGIVLGSVAGFLFVLWLLWMASNGTSFIRTTAIEEEDVVIRRRSRSPRSHRSRRPEMSEGGPRRERVVRTERIVRDSVPPPREPSRIRETIVVEESRPERRVQGDDIVEVIEEHDSIGEIPPPRRKSRRSSAYR